MPPQTVRMKYPSCDMMLARLDTSRILAEMTLAIPTGEIHMIMLTILTNEKVKSVDVRVHGEILDKWLISISPEC